MYKKWYQYGGSDLEIVNIFQSGWCIYVCKFVRRKQNIHVCDHVNSDIHCNFQLNEASSFNQVADMFSFYSFQPNLLKLIASWKLLEIRFSPFFAVISSRG